MNWQKAPSEEAEQLALAEWLDWNRIQWCHVPNGGMRDYAVAAKLAAAGVKRGVPDILVFDRPTKCDRGRNHPPIGGDHDCLLYKVGVALELKRSTATPSRVRPEQLVWIEALKARGWVAEVVYGADKAIFLLKQLGIGRERL